MLQLNPFKRPNQQPTSNPSSSQSSLLALPDLTQTPSGYDRRATGIISVDYVYKPESFVHEMRAGGYGEAVSYLEVMQLLGQYPCEDFLGVSIIGTDAGRYLGKRLVNHFENYGFGHGFCFDVTRVVAMIPLKDAMGCGACPGNTVVVSPGTGFIESLDTLYHEYLHNCGWEHPKDGNGIQIHDRVNDPIYIEARKVANYLSQFPEA